MQNVMDMWFIKDNNDNMYYVMRQYPDGEIKSAKTGFSTKKEVKDYIKSYGFKPREENIYA